MGEKFSLVIGVEKYIDPKIPPVAFAENDAQEIGKAIALHGYEGPNSMVLLSSSATKSTIESRIKNILSHAGEDDYVLIFYAGHGFAENDHNFLTCADTIKDDLVNTSISLKSVLSGIKKSHCKKVMLFLDSCHSGLDIDESMRSILTDMSETELAEFLKDSEYHMAFASCQTDQYSYSSKDLRHGVWTYLIIDALKGNSPQALEKKRFLTATSLQNYLSKELPRSLRKLFTGKQVQNPRLFGNLSKDFIVADFEAIFEKRAIDLQPKLAQLKKVLFSGSISGNGLFAVSSG